MVQVNGPSHCSFEKVVKVIALADAAVGESVRGQIVRQLWAGWPCGSQSLTDRVLAKLPVSLMRFFGHSLVLPGACRRGRVPCVRWRKACPRFGGR